MNDVFPVRLGVGAAVLSHKVFHESRFVDWFRIGTIWARGFKFTKSGWKLHLYVSLGNLWEDLFGFAALVSLRPVYKARRKVFVFRPCTKRGISAEEVALVCRQKGEMNCFKRRKCIHMHVSMFGLLAEIERIMFAWIGRTRKISRAFARCAFGRAESGSETVLLVFSSNLLLLLVLGVDVVWEWFGVGSWMFWKT